MRRHFKNVCQYRTEWAAVCEFRKRVSWYAKTMAPCAMLKERVRLIDTAEDFESALNDFLEWREARDLEVERKRETMVAEVA
jgi:tRNA-dihydrouridine synthase